MKPETGVLRVVLEQMIGTERTDRLCRVLVIHPDILGDPGPSASRAVMAQALNMLLFEDLLERVPMAAAYVEDCLREGRTVVHDHGAVRTVALQIAGKLPAGEEAIVRLLRPLGYELNGVYPLERLKMTGRSYAQVEFPEDIAQFFISELHPERFSQLFQATVRKLMDTATDPLTVEAELLLEDLEGTGRLPVDDAVALLPVLVGCFGRQHQQPSVEDYQTLLKESAEMAWISTEGNAFNHATDRVADVEELAARQKSLGRPMKEVVETSKSGRVRQTAFLAAKVKHLFAKEDGSAVEMEVPGSFYEFITRLPMPESHALDLSFDSSNAQAIFQMTAGAK